MGTVISHGHLTYDKRSELGRQLNAAEVWEREGWEQSFDMVPGV